VRGLRICNAWFSTLFTSQPYEVDGGSLPQASRPPVRPGRTGHWRQRAGQLHSGQTPEYFGAQKPVYTEEEWKKVTEGFNRLGKLAAEKGMKLTCHHHMGTGVQTEGKSIAYGGNGPGGGWPAV
jgi:inosose dehydratase